MVSKSLKFDPQNLAFTTVIGTGGIGSGKFFVLNGNNTLGREESRSGHFLQINDYCKQHIILHYIKVLLGDQVNVIPVGKVGDDDIGHNLFNEMRETGFEMKRVEIIPDLSTLFSFCFYYPDGSGGNLTTDNSASSAVDKTYIEKALPEIVKSREKGIIMAAPEVPLETRQKLLEMGKNNGLYCTASFTSEEIIRAMDSGALTFTDLIAINIDEASAVADSIIDRSDTISIVHSAVQKLKALNENLMISVTAGSNGSWCWDGYNLTSFPSIKTKAVSTAGAGDAFFSGIICGLALGFKLFEAQQLATLIAGLSVTSPDTINKLINRQSLNSFLNKSGLTFSGTIIKLLED